MAIVYLAKDRFLDRLVAVKVLRDEYIEDPEFIRHFQKEARSVAALNHPNIVNIYDFDAHGDPSYLVMEYVEGQTLKEMVMKEGPMQWDSVIDIGIQIANGLAEAHRNHIIHKDVKSHNILVDQSGMVKITDFGISQMLSSTTITHNKGILGSAHYFSPEQARGERVDEKSDIYSLGIVLYEMLSGQVPFSGDNPVTVALKHIQETPRPLRELYDDIPEALEQVVMTCLAKDKDARYPSMSALARDLERIRESEPFTPRASAPRVAVVRPESVSNGAGDDTLTLPRDLTQKQPTSAVPKAARVPRESRQTSKRRNRFQLVLVVVIIILAAMATLKLSALFSPRGDIEVPDFQGMSMVDAEELATKAHLQVEITEEVYDDEIEVDHIVSQSPRPGRKVQKDDVIEVVVSKGTETIRVPDLSGKTEDEAKAALRKAGLRLGDVEEEESEDEEAGTVISQTPRAGHKADPKARVHITLAKEPETKMVSLPDLRGRSLDNAKETLANLKLTLGTVEEVSPGNNQRGTVLTQSSEPGTKLPEGSTVNFTVAGAPDNQSNSGSGSQRNAMRIQFSVPTDGRIDVYVDDASGSRQVHSGTYSAGDYFNQSFPYQGNGRLRVLLNDREIDSIPLG